MEYKIKSYSEADTVALAENIESEKFKNMVICLEGDLGSGKTIFTKGFARSMEIKEPVTSPTFNIIKEYTEGELPLYHMDVYRLEGSADSIGIEDYYKKGGICIIEWADMIEDSLPKHYLKIKFKIVDENTRTIILEPKGPKYEEVCEAVV